MIADEGGGCGFVHMVVQGNGNQQLLRTGGDVGKDALEIPLFVRKNLINGLTHILFRALALQTCVVKSQIERFLQAKCIALVQFVSMFHNFRTNLFLKTLKIGGDELHIVLFQDGAKV